MDIVKGLRFGAIALAAMLPSIPSVAADPVAPAISFAVIRPSGTDPVSFVSHDRTPVTQLNHWVSDYLGPVYRRDQAFVLTSDQLQEAVALSNERKATPANNLLIAFLTRFGLITGAPGTWTLTQSALERGVVITAGTMPGVRQDMARTPVQRASR